MEQEYQDQGSELDRMAGEDLQELSTKDRDTKIQNLRYDIFHKQGQLLSNLTTQRFLIAQQLKMEEELRDLKDDLKELDREVDSERGGHPEELI